MKIPRHLFSILGLCVVLPFLPFSSSLAQDTPQEVEVYFSPEDQLADRLISLIAKEEKSIQIAVYCFTHQGIMNALTEAKKRGVDVEVIVDPYSMRNRPAIGKLAKAGISIWIWEGRNRGERRALMHNKFALFGDGTLWSGSFNFTYDANKMHAENALVLKNSVVQERFRKKFEEIKLSGSIPFSEYLKKNK